MDQSAGWFAGSTVLKINGEKKNTFYRKYIKNDSRLRMLSLAGKSFNEQEVDFKKMSMTGQLFYR